MEKSSDFRVPETQQYGSNTFEMPATDIPVVDYHELICAGLVKCEMETSYSDSDDIILCEDVEEDFGAGSKSARNGKKKRKSGTRKKQSCSVNPLKYQCHVCNKPFKLSRDLKEHLTTHAVHITASDMLGGEQLAENQCPVCKKQFNRISNLREHMVVHTGEKKHQCQLCMKCFTRSSTLKLHLKRHSAGQKPLSQLEELEQHLSSYNRGMVVKNSPFSVANKRSKGKGKGKGKLKKDKTHTGENNDELADGSNLMNQSQVSNKHIGTLEEYLAARTFEAGYSIMPEGEPLAENQCPVCKKQFNRKSNLREHMVVHTREKKHQCQICKKRFTRGSTLKMHLQRHGSFQCQLCPKRFSQIRKLRLHYSSHDDDEIVQNDPVNDEQCTDNLDEHSGTRDEQVKGSDKVGEHSGTRDEQFKSTEKVGEYSGTRTWEPDQRFGVFDKELNRSATFQCDRGEHSGIRTGETSHLPLLPPSLPHHSSLHTPSSTPYPPSIPHHPSLHTSSSTPSLHTSSFTPSLHTSSFTPSPIYNPPPFWASLHAASSTPAPMYTPPSFPPYLNRTATFQSDRGEHSGTRTEEPDQRFEVSDKDPKRSGTFRCDRCPKVFKYKSNLTRHMLSHNKGYKRFKCKTCKKMFTTKSHLKTHSLIHSKIKRFKCSVCEHPFRTKYEVTTHMVVHTQVKEFKCEYCQKLFAYKTSLSAHIKVHFGVKDYHCLECGKQFTYKNSLKKHKLIHTGVKAFQCQQCGNQFTHKCSLKNHKCLHKLTPPTTLHGNTPADTKKYQNNAQYTVSHANTATAPTLHSPYQLPETHPYSYLSQFHPLSHRQHAAAGMTSRNTSY